MRWVLLLLLLSACSSELPGFANPPDAGPDGEDAGASDAGRD